MGESSSVLKAKYPIIDAVAKNAHIKGVDEYDALYKRSIEDPAGFWAELARKNLDWFRDFDQTMSGSLAKGDAAWFLNGSLNVSVNCIDRHIKDKADKVAIIWEGDEVGTGRKITYMELLEETCRIANAMKGAGVKKGDTVAIYMPMIPEVAFVMLACCRLGAIHRYASYFSCCDWGLCIFQLTHSSFFCCCPFAVLSSLASRRTLFATVSLTQSRR